jgi:signal transduction histidine kinase
MAVIEIRDSGCGIPADVGERVFEPLFTTKEVGRGSGQGLPIARTLMTRHGGRIDFASTPSAGHDVPRRDLDPPPCDRQPRTNPVRRLSPFFR